MNRYQLAKLVSWVGRLQTRKRLQKVVYMLQSTGCPIEADFTLHRYGPYSEGVARLADEMVRASLLEEEASENAVGTQYSYVLSDQVQKQVRELEATEQGKRWAAELAPFEAKAKQFLTAELKQLEYASTIVFFRRQGLNWDSAVEKAVSFKNTPSVRNALPLAKQVVP